MKFIARCLSTSATPIPAPQIKPLSEALASLLEDPFEGARNEAAVCLGTLMKMVGERPLNALMDGLADVRKAKVKEAFDNAKVKAKAGSGPPPKPAAPPAAKEPPKKKMPPAKKAPTTDLPAVPTEEEVLTPTENKPPKKPPARLMVCLFVRLMECSNIRNDRQRNLPLVVVKAAHLLPRQHRQ